MNISEITNKLVSEYANRRIQEDARASWAQAKANSSPEFVKLNRLEKELIFDLGKLEAENKPTKKLKTELEKVKTQKAQVLENLGLVEADLKPKYTCPVCKDTGYIGTVMCSCLKNKINKEIIIESGFSPASDVSFDTFNCDFENKTQSKELEKLKKFLLEWCNKYPNTKSKLVTLVGKTGVGKTFSIKCTANELVKKGLSVCFVSAFEMNNLFLKYHSTFTLNKGTILAPLTKADVLFVDDLGTEPVINNVTSNYLYLVLTERERFNKSTFITTNLNLNQLKERYGERITSRLSSKESAKMILLSGDDLRIKNHKNG